MALATTWQFQWLANRWRVDGLDGLEASLAGACSGGSRLPRGRPCTSLSMPTRHGCCLRKRTPIRLQLNAFSRLGLSIGVNKFGATMYSSYSCREWCVGLWRLGVAVGPSSAPSAILLPFLPSSDSYRRRSAPSVLWEPSTALGRSFASHTWVPVQSWRAGRSDSDSRGFCGSGR